MTEDTLQRYRMLVDQGDLKLDPVQELAARKLTSLSHAIRSYAPRAGIRGWAARLGFSNLCDNTIPVQGLYIYGGVGRGKSMLMELFFESIPIKAKKRIHFHAFLRDIHAEVHHRRQLSLYEGEGDPIPGMADGIADSIDLLCLDELEVRDIADAMIVGRLFEQLFERGVVVVSTSNRHPDDLYKDGLQRERFVPFIDLIKENLELLELEAARDYRLDSLAEAAVYHTPLGPIADQALDAAWARLTDEAIPVPDYVLVQGRRIHVPFAAHQVACFAFNDLCGQPLGPSDYMAIASQYSTLLVKGIPSMDDENKDKARRFVTLIDALYDHRTAFICSAAAPPDQLYKGKDGGFEFQRTVSRLIEMQAADYIRQKHLD
ncbi:MAG TPA: cell division protein ZapE [Rhodospirillaceae bacterium]|nr:cell division protein ZapE [Candidatus Neomarinimicrobiota bacterium]HCX14782.1 cell division protein ZapE [Rhodospirillaceae bacterium]